MPRTSERHAIAYTAAAGAVIAGCALGASNYSNLFPDNSYRQAGEPDFIQGDKARIEIENTSDTHTLIAQCMGTAIVAEVTELETSIVMQNSQSCSDGIINPADAEVLPSDLTAMLPRL